jgi:hypothetical protein
MNKLKIFLMKWLGINDIDIEKAFLSKRVRDLEWKILLLEDYLRITKEGDNYVKRNKDNYQTIKDLKGK